MGKTALITGASSGIGRSCAKLFAKNKIDLIIIARRLERLTNLSNELKKDYGIRVLPIKLDVKRQEDVFSSLDNLPEGWENIDILINAAGLSKGLEKLQDGKIENWENMIDTNIKGLLYVTKTILPKMVKQQSGTVVNVASIAGHETYVGGNVYCATKSAVLQLSKAMRMDLLGTGVRVVSIDPGMVETEFSVVRFNGDKKRAEKVYKNIDALTPEDIAQAIYFAVSMPDHVTIEDMVIMPTQQASVTMNIKNYKRF